MPFTHERVIRRLVPYPSGKRDSAAMDAVMNTIADMKAELEALGLRPNEYEVWHNRYDAEIEMTGMEGRDGDD